MCQPLAESCSIYTATVPSAKLFRSVGWIGVTEAHRVVVKPTVQEQQTVKHPAGSQASEGKWQDQNPHKFFSLFLQF